MKLSEIFAIAESFGAVKLSKDYCKQYDMYDNSGIIIDAGKQITGVVFALDCTDHAIDVAIEKGYNLILTHHPFIFGGIKNIHADDLQGKKILRCLQQGISVISMHLNYDITEGGIDEQLMLGLGGKSAVCMEQIEGGAYGRVYEITPCALTQFTQQIKSTFQAKNLMVFGEGECHKVASFCGAGTDDRSVAFALQQGADTLVSSDLKHHHIMAMVEAGMKVVQMTHYASENYGFRQITSKIMERLSIPSHFVMDERFV